MGPEIAILLEPYDAVYVEIPKVACTSIKVALARLLGIRLDHLGGDPHAADFPAPAAPFEGDGSLYPGLFTFAFTRNPWDRLLSCYRDKIRGEVPGFTSFTIRPGVADCLAGHGEFFADMSFDEFIRAVDSIPDGDADAHFRSQHSFLQTGAGRVGADFVGRFETLQSDLERVARAIGLAASLELPRLQSAQITVNYVDFYTSETQGIVARRFREDIETFGYDFASSSG